MIFCPDQPLLETIHGLVNGSCKPDIGAIYGGENNKLSAGSVVSLNLALDCFTMNLSVVQYLAMALGKEQVRSALEMAGIGASEAESSTHGSAKSLISAIKANDRVSSSERNELMQKLERVNRYESIQQDNSR